MRDGPSTRDDNGDGVTRCDGAPQVSTAVCDSLRRGDGAKWAGAGIDNDPGDGLNDSLFTRAKSQLSERPCLHAPGNVRMRMRENGMLLISSGQDEAKF